MKPDLKETEALLDTLEKRFPDARADVEAVRTQIGLGRRAAESHNAEITDRLARDSDDKAALGTYGPQDSEVPSEDRPEEPRPMPHGYGKERLIDALCGITKPPSEEPEPKIGETFRPKPSFPPTIGLYKLADLLHVAPDEVFRARHYIQKHTVPMGCPRSSESDHVPLRTAYAIHLLLHGNEAVHRWIPVTSFCSGVYTNAVREFLSTPSFPYLVKLFMGHEHSSIVMALRELFKEKTPERTTEDLRCLHVLAGVIRNAKNYVPTREKDVRKAD